MPFKDSGEQENFHNRFLAIVEQSPFSIQILSPDGFTVQVNKAWEELWGLTLEKIKDYNMLEDEQLVKNGVMPYIKRGFAGEYAEIPPILYDPNETIPDLTAHPAPRWTKAVIYPIKDSAGRVQEVVLMHQDISEQIQAEEKIKASELRYRNLLENANDIIYSHDLSGKYLSINKAGEEITGYTREDILGGMNIAQLVVPEHLELAKKMTERKLRDSSPTVYEIDILAKDGRRLTLEVSTRIQWTDEKPAVVEGVARDITERKQAEREKARLAEQVEKQRKHLQEMVANVPGVVWEAWGEPDAATQRIDFVSDYVETMLGYSVEEWLAAPNFWLSIVHPEDKASAAQTAAETFASGKAGTNRFRWMTKDGRAIWVESHSIAVLDDAGNPSGMRGVTMDVSESRRKEANEQFLAEASTALASSLDYETTLATFARLAVPHFADWCSVDVAGEDGTLNRLAVAHIDPEKVVWAREINERYPADQNAPHGLYNVLRTGESEFYPDIPDEMLVQTARDEEHLEIMRQIGFRSAIMVPLKTRGRILGVITFVNCEGNRHYTTEDLALAENLANRAALAIDNARLFQSEHEIRQAAERTSDLLKRLQSVSVSLSQALTPQQVAEAVVEHAVSTLGAHAGTLVLLDEGGTELEIVGAVNFPSNVVQNWTRFPLSRQIPIADAIRGNTPVIVESFTEWNGVYPELGLLGSVTGSRALAAFPLTVEGRIIGALGLSFPEPQRFSEDDKAFMLALAQQCAQPLERARLYETERKLRTQAEAANQMKDEFLATLSHELRTPLNAILGWSQMLKLGNLDEAGAEKAITTIERNARAQTQLIDDLLDVSRIITGKLRLDIRPVDLSNVITAAADAVRPAAEAKDIRLQTLLDSHAALISGDPDRLQQVVWNLLSNAVKFTPKGGRVQVRLERINSHVEIVVSDTGIGISEEFLPHVFERFRQLDGSKTRRHGGLGLGLAIVRQLIELHGGTVSVESAGAEQGSTFIVRLPFLPLRKESAGDVSRVHPAARSNVLEDCPAELTGFQILLVDDETDSRDLLSLVLDSCGAAVTTAKTAAEALEIFLDKRFDVIISDIGMPGEDGYSLIAKIRNSPVEQGGNTPAIALTAYARAEDRIQSLRAGFQMHISKPVEPTELVAVVANLVERMRSSNS